MTNTNEKEHDVLKVLKKTKIYFPNDKDCEQFHTLI